MPAILAARWIAPVTSPPIRNGAIALEGDRIVGVGTRTELLEGYPGASVRDLGEALIVPGFVNLHSHLELTLLRGRLEEPHFQTWIATLIRLKREELSPRHLLAGARLGCREAILSGITTLADTSDANAPLEALIEAGLRGVVFQEVFGPDPAQAGASIGRLEEQLEAHARTLEAAPAEARRRLKVGVSPHAPYSVSGLLYERVSALARANRLDMAIHAAESDDEIALVREGKGAFADALRKRAIPVTPGDCSAIEYLERHDALSSGPLLIHCVKIDDRDVERIASSASRVAHCPKSNAKLGHGIAPLGRLMRAGVRVGLGTDGAVSNNQYDLIDEARFAGLLQRAFHRDAALFPSVELLRLMTIEGARALGMEGEIGSIEVGKQADLVAINLETPHGTPHPDPIDTLMFSSRASDVTLTMVAGRVLYDRLQRSDVETSILEEVRRLTG